MNVVIYSRTSTKKQNIKDQTLSLLELCNINGWSVKKYFQDVAVSGLENNRSGINEMISYIEDNEIDKIIISELSRLSRDIEHTKYLINYFIRNNISIYISDMNMETLSKGDINFNLINVLYDELKYNNREIYKIRDRMQRGFKTFIQKSGKVGRKKGYRITEMQLLLRHDDVVNSLKKGYSIRMIMSICGKSTGTVQKIRRILKKDGAIKISNIDLIDKLVELDGVKELLKTNIV